MKAPHYFSKLLVFVIILNVSLTHIFADEENDLLVQIKAAEFELLKIRICDIRLSNDLMYEKTERLSNLRQRYEIIKEANRETQRIQDKIEKINAAKGKIEGLLSRGNKVDENTPEFCFIIKEIKQEISNRGGDPSEIVSQARNVLRPIYEKCGASYSDEYIKRIEQKRLEETKRSQQLAAQQAANEIEEKRLAYDKFEKEMEEWKRLVSGATAKKPYVNSVGISFARVSGTDFMVALTPVSKSALAKSSGIRKTDNSPAISTWRQANDFCTWLSFAENKNYHLPSEKEWKAVVQSHVLEGKGESWTWSADVASGGEAFWAEGNGKGLRGNSVKILDRTQSYDDVVTHCILAPKM